MRRTGPPERKTPLENRTELKRSTPLRSTPAAKLSGAGLSRKARTATRKPMRQSRPRVGRDEVEARRVVAQRSGHVCELCGQRRATNWHHRQNRGQAGVWRPANGLHLCGSGTTGCHGDVTANPARARTYGWSVRSTQDPAHVAVWLHGRGWCLLADDGSITPVSTKDEETG